MKTKKILLALAFALVLSSCANVNLGKKDNVSDTKVESTVEDKDKTSAQAKEDDQDKKDKDEKESSDKKEEKIDYDKWRGYITGVGQFDTEVLDKISDEDIKDYYLRAKATCDKTGYWDVKDIVFQQIAKDYPDYSNKFPYDFIDEIYSWNKSKDEVSDKYQEERTNLINLGYDPSKVNKITDKDLEKAFKKAYKDNEEGLYTDYVSAVGKDLFGDNKEANSTDDKTLKFAENDADYDEFKQGLVQAYGFSQESVDKISKDDIDLAYTRAQKKLEETGFGDVGLIINELAKMYPGSSTMYPGN